MSAEDAMVVRQSREVLATHARSFRWASRFLGPAQRDDASVVYAFCRLVDDTADEAMDGHRARFELERLRKELHGEAPARPLIEAFLDVSTRRKLDIRYADELIEGVLSDLGSVVFQTDEELLRYCYRVAGTVGLMMCAVLDVKDPSALPHAIDLGVGMQLTNICRDVLEDAQMGRVYLPAERLRRYGVEPSELLDGTADADAVAAVVTELLDQAERYYRSADFGMRYIPLKSRFAIVVAGRLYRAIGLKLRRNESNPLEGRTWIGWPGKILWCMISLMAFFGPRILGFTPSPGHDRELHTPLHGLPGVSADTPRLEVAA